MNISKITKEELERLEACQTADEWADACDAVKDARAGNYPEDWWPKVKLSGMMDRILERWDETSELKLIDMDTGKETVLDETEDNLVRYKELQQKFDEDPNSLTDNEVNEALHLTKILMDNIRAPFPQK